MIFPVGALPAAEIIPEAVSLYWLKFAATHIPDWSLKAEDLKGREPGAGRAKA